MRGGVLVFNEDKFRLGRWKIWEMDYGESCTTIGMSLVPLNSTVKYVKMCVCCVCVCVCVYSVTFESFQSLDCSPPGSSVHGISQARILEQVAFPPPRDLPDPRIKPTSLMSPALTGRFFTTVPPGKPKVKMVLLYYVTFIIIKKKIF